MWPGPITPYYFHPVLCSTVESLPNLPIVPPLVERGLIYHLSAKINPILIKVQRCLSVRPQNHI